MIIERQKQFGKFDKQLAKLGKTNIEALRRDRQLLKGTGTVHDTINLGGYGRWGDAHKRYVNARKGSIFNKRSKDTDYYIHRGHNKDVIKLKDQIKHDQLMSAQKRRQSKPLYKEHGVSNLGDSKFKGYIDSDFLSYDAQKKLFPNWW